MGRTAHGLAHALGRVVRTTATAIGLGLALLVASLTALVVSKDPAPLVVSFLALAVTAFQFWRTDLRGPDVTILLMDSTAVDILAPEAYGGADYVLTVRQPIVVENVGGSPCVLAKFRIDGELIKTSVWGHENLVIEDGLGGPWDKLRPEVLDPHQPRLFTAAWSLTALGAPGDGKPLNLRHRVERSGLGAPTRHADLAYSETGTTVRKFVRIAMNETAIRQAVEQLLAVSEGDEATMPIRSPDPIHIDFTDVPDGPPPVGRDE